jgi:DNA-binding NarL/FixJ family response regulator
VQQDVMRDRRGKNYKVHGIAQTRSAGAIMNGSSRELINLVRSNTEVGAAEAATTIVVIDKRELIRKCFAQCLQAASKHTIVSFPNVDSWFKVCEDNLTSLVLLCVAGKPTDPETRRDITRLCQQADRVSVILVSDVEDPDQIADAVGRGARGYIPTSMPLEVVIEIIRVVRAGGVFVPASSLMAGRQSNNCSTASQHGAAGLFTARQAAVVEALRRGKANKIIAHELNMRESTVKVHIRNIMKKLKARNRTEVAFMTNEIMQNGSAA